MFPALAAAGTVALTGAIARELGGRGWAVALACAGSLSAAVYLAIGNFYSLNVFEPLFWMGCIYSLVRIINGGTAKFWLLFGLLAGLGVENKHSIAFFGAGIVGALLLTRERRQFARPGIWVGGLIAAVITLPNVLWQIRHGWPTLELLQNVARSDKNVVLGPLQFIGQQILILNPATLLLWGAGLLWLLFARDARRYRSLGIAYLITLAEFIIMHGKHYYLAPIYPMLFAAGGVAFERLCARRFQWAKPVLAAVILALGALIAPTILPVLPPEKLPAYMQAIHFEPPRTETSHTAALPQLFADQFGWEEMVRSVARAYQHLSPDEQKIAAIFCQNYGQAGAIDFFGPKYGLPRALCGHQNYYLWGPRGYDGKLLLVIDDSSEDEAQQFRSVDDLGPVDFSRWSMPWEKRNHLYLCRDLKGSVSELWPNVKKWL